MGPLLLIQPGESIFHKARHESNVEVARDPAIQILIYLSAGPKVFRSSVPEGGSLAGTFIILKRRSESSKKAKTGKYRSADQ